MNRLISTPIENLIPEDLSSLSINEITTLAQERLIYQGKTVSPTTLEAARQALEDIILPPLFDRLELTHLHTDESNGLERKTASAE